MQGDCVTRALLEGMTVLDVQTFFSLGGTLGRRLNRNFRMDALINGIADLKMENNLQLPELKTWIFHVSFSKKNKEHFV